MESAPSDVGKALMVNVLGPAMVGFVTPLRMIVTAPPTGTATGDKKLTA